MRIAINAFLAVLLVCIVAAGYVTVGQTPHADDAQQNAAPAIPAPERGNAGATAARGRGRGRTFDEAAVTRGQTLFGTQCGFCHGPDARGRAAGPDLARSLVVLNDTKGKEFGAFVRVGRPEAGMPAFSTLTDDQVSDIAEFLHKTVETARNRTPSNPLASVVGDPAAGALYFQTHCTNCHSVTGDLKGIGVKYDPITLQDRLVDPRPRGRGVVEQASPRSTRTVTVTLPTGEKVTGTLDYISEFDVTLIDASGKHRSFKRNGDAPGVVVIDPLQVHWNMLRTFKDKDIHDLTAYLVTLNE